MIPIIIMSHGEMAKGIQKTVQMIAGNQECIHFLGLNDENPADFHCGLKAILNMYPKEQTKLIFADLFGGSPYLLTAELILKEQVNCQLVSGVNLPMVIDCLFSRDKMQTEELITHVIQVGQAGIVQFKQVAQKEEEDEGI